MSDNPISREERRILKKKKQQKKIICLIILLVLLLACIVAAVVVSIQNGKSSDGEEAASQTETETQAATEAATEEATEATPVITDTEAPVIEGAADIEIYVGDSVSYKANITVTDDQDPEPVLTIDNSGVDLNTAGTYPVTYTATDAAGNSASVTINLIITEKPEGYVDEATVNALAQEVLDSITDDSMSQMEVAFAIYHWCLTNISYTGSSDKSSWVQGAYQAFTEHSGDCFNYFAAAKAMYNVAGIDNVDIVKSDTSHSSHYWSLINLGNGWYHVDCTPRKGTGDNFFMVTDAELLAYSEAHNNSHIFDSSLYPERATESLQYMVDYTNYKILD